MPTYEYECDNCGKHLEVFQSISASVLKNCPKCKKPKLKRLIGGSGGFIFKGSGFYATDYRKGKREEKRSCPLKKEGKANDGCKSCPRG